MIDAGGGGSVAPVGCVVVTTTVGSAEVAEGLARSIVDGRLAACVHVVPIRSVYRWQGEICAEPEWRCEAKTTDERAGALIEHIRANHGYHLPEIVAIPISGSEDYLAWVAAESAESTESTESAESAP